ncbi:CHAT domain-containing protein [Lentzea sp. NPDC058450]|uniref:CHAT domain-containing protein n=1 Tax=Lentzea sp. NPDC058450 TaxID=3346505 RepID=UPI00364ABD9C
MSRRPPRTIFGYSPPRRAEVVGWRCHQDGCHRAESEVPRRWPHPCDNCGHPADPVFAEPWAHEARGVELSARAEDPSDDHDSRFATVELPAWRFEDALRRGDRAAAVEACADLGRLADRLRANGTTWHLSTARWKVVVSALRHGEPDLAADGILGFFEDVRAIGKAELEQNDPRTDARMFVGACLLFLCDERSLGHQRENDVVAVMVDRHDLLRKHDFSVGSLDDDRKRAMDLRAMKRGTKRPRVPELPPPADVPVSVDSRDLPGPVEERIEFARAVIAAARRGQRQEELAAVVDGMSRMVLAGNGTSVATAAAAVLADAALAIAEIHDDPEPLFAAADRLDGSSAVTRLLRAQGHVVLGEFTLAEQEIEEALRHSGSARQGLLPHLHAVRGWLLVRDGAASIDDGIDACRTGRDLGRGDVTPADPVLAGLLVEKALHRGTPASDAVPLLEEALHLAGPSGAHAVAQEARSALAALTGPGDSGTRQEDWRTAVRDAQDVPVTAQLRLATAWVRWALGTGQAELAADAYHHVVSLLPALVRVRYRADAQARVLATVREHTEEAGYWLAKAHRYRDAAVALETGRAVVLSTLVERDDPVVAAALADAGRGDLLALYREALDSGGGHQEWARFRAVAREVADVIGADPVEPAVEYTDITRATGDGALVYVAAAEAGGYALIIASAHDPQCVWLPDLGRFSVEEWLRGQSGEVEERGPRMSADLDWLWRNGMRELLAFFAHGSIITLIPIGALTRLPLHATAGRALHFPAVRYAPNARTLHWCRSRAATMTGQPARLLVADVPNAPEGELPFASIEAAAVASTWPERCDRLPEATWAEFAPAAHRYDIWHVVCHGKVDLREILLSSLLFTDREVTIADLRERFRFAPRRLAIISACDMQNVGARTPNEAAGLPSALLQLGFAGVVSASWPVFDRATAFLMTRFHQVLRDGAHPAVALAVAQNWLRNADFDDLAAVAPSIPLPERGKRPRPFAHPWNWAAFAYTGG